MKSHASRALDAVELSSDEGRVREDGLLFVDLAQLLEHALGHLALAVEGQRGRVHLAVEITTVLEVAHVLRRLGEIGQVLRFELPFLKACSYYISYITDELFILQFEHSDANAYV